MTAYSDESLKHKYLMLLIDKFQKEKKQMNVLIKIDLTNLIIERSKSQRQLLNNKFLETLFVYLVKENTSLYFYKCVDIIYVLKHLSKLRFVKSYTEFWLKIEDLLMRMKHEFKLEEVIEIVELYTDLKKGSAIFWEELEKFVLKNSSDFKRLDSNLTIRMVLAYN